MSRPTVLSDAQRTFYRANGYLVVEQVVPDAFLDDLQAELERLVDRSIERWEREGLIGEHYADLGFASRYLVSWLAAGRPAIATADANGRAIVDAFAGFVRQDWLADVVADVLGAEDIAPIASCHYRAKFPDDASTTLPWHQDAPCVKPIAGIDFVTAWIPLVDVTEATSCLEVSPVGHDQGAYEARWSTQLGYLFMDASDVARLREARAVPMRRGDALLLSPFVPHRTLDNVGPSIRWSVDFRYSPT